MGSGARVSLDRVRIETASALRARQAASPLVGKLVRRDGEELQVEAYDRAKALVHVRRDGVASVADAADFLSSAIVVIGEAT